jgi:hypothetical protein
MSILLGAAMAAAMIAPQGYADVQQRVAPRGGYAQSCSGAYVNQGRLYADCRDMRGQMRGTSIELARCSSSEISNDNGLLVCGRVRGSYEDSRPGYPGYPGAPSRPDRPDRPDRPGDGWGGGRSSITVYEDSNYRGRSMTFNGEVSNLDRTGMNDRISSMRLRGRWEVCTDAYFRGSCRVIDGDERNLGSSGFNDRISSLRPARRR